MNIRFTKISQRPSRPSVKHYLIPIFYMVTGKFGPGKFGPSEFGPDEFGPKYKC